MTTILRRVLNIIKAYGSSLQQARQESDAFTGSGEEASQASSRFGIGSRKAESRSSYKDYPPEIIRDLANFNLSPPSSLEAVKKARNREIRRYHPDRFADDPERQKTANEIMQIYNASYSRLKRFFQNRS